MSILDEAIREHLELKRQHGAGDSELKQLEDEAFGPPGRPGDEETPPDPFAEAPTEFMAAPGTSDEALVEPWEESPPKREAASDIGALQEGPEEPAEEEHPAAEHEVVPEPSGPSTEERHAIADQPTEMYDVEAELSGAEENVPSDDQLVEEEMSEPRLSSVEPLAGLEEGDEVEIRAAGDEVVEEEEEDEFWDEQRLSDELSQALESPAEEEDPVAEAEEEAAAEEAEIDGEPAAESESDRSDQGEDEDILEDTPEFLEDSEDDQLWFEQKPPKDFDFDD